MSQKLRILVVGCGRMGASHARAYHKLRDDFTIVGLVSRGASSRQTLNAALGGGLAEFSDFKEALSLTHPEAVCLSTYPNTHAAYAIAAMEAGAHVFLEKPLADNLADAEQVIATARRTGRKLMVGYILHVHPSWQKFTAIARTLGKPLVMRMNLNQQISGSNWDLHKNLLQSTSPLVDCGVHYVDIMGHMTQSHPVRVNAIGARLTNDIALNQINYGQLQVVFADGSIGWYESGWGPMISETAFFIKDVIGPKGSVSIVAESASAFGQSSSIDAHTKTETIRIHHAALGPDGQFVRQDEIVDVGDEPGHDELCLREQQAFLRAIRDDEDQSVLWQSALVGLSIVFAAEKSLREGITVELPPIPLTGPSHHATA